VEAPVLRSHVAKGPYSPIVVLSEAQRSLMERVLKKVLAALPALPYVIEVGVEVAPDGTWRVLLRLRTP
jgi:hypothetical protein